MSGSVPEGKSELYARLAKLLAQIAVRLVRQRDRPEVAEPKE